METRALLDGRVTLHAGDCVEVMAHLPTASVDAVVTDPPYHLTANKKGGTGAASMNLQSPAGRSRIGTGGGFMGKQWDGGDVAFRVETWAAVFRLLKPGAHLVAFSSTRTYHRMACAIEDAGFEIRDQLAWMYGSGFPKSHNQHGDWEGWGTALKPAWEPIVLARKPLDGTVAANLERHGVGALNIDGCRVGTTRGVPASLSKNKMPNIYGGGLGGGIERDLDPNMGRWPANVIHDGSDEVVAAFPDAPGQQREVTGAERAHRTVNAYGVFNGARHGAEPRQDGGSAARFFASFPSKDDEQCTRSNVSIAEHSFSLSSERAVSALSRVVGASIPEWALLPESYLAPSIVATASEFALISEIVTIATQSIGRRCSPGSRPERLTLTLSHAECVAEPGPTDTITITISRWRSSGSVDPVTFSITQQSEDLGASACAINSRFHYSAKADANDRIASKHPTVKPVDLMQWLVRLVTPKGGLVLDPFAGTGTTGEAAWREGMRAVLIEREAEYQADIVRRMALATEGPDGRRRGIARAKGAEAEPMPLFGGAA